MKITERIIKVKGHRYKQIVWYEWDKKSGKSITHVIKHLGPALPVNYIEVNKRRIENEPNFESTEFNAINFSLQRVEILKTRVLGSSKKSSKIKLPAEWKNKIVWVVLPRDQ